ncbi:MAG TPA: Flp family type IVb pilin [Novosphingobium capsulatum]|nr:Flp family type IVb pilin [Novosphingobium aromaticivorans]HIQ17506.1 Flp family type IVb pilin [Novosphingobium capsulatum]
MTFFRKLIKDTEGATAIEYGLIAALIAVAAITAMGALGNSISNTFGSVSTQLNTAKDNAGKVTQ